jgi:hypothetical protein
VPAGRILAQTPRGLLLAIFVGTVGTLLSIFIRGVIVHLLLLLVGGANARFETTMRVMSYVGGAVALLQVVPFVGLLVAWVATVFYEIIGLSAAHETTKGKSAVAVVLPVVACCLLAGLAVAALVTAAMH